MKKLHGFIPVMLLALTGFTAVSCDDKDEPVSSDKLPAGAKAFLTEYYSGASVVSTRKDKDEYEVTLSDGTRIEFYKDGEWTDVDAPAGKTVPKGFYPVAIDTYIDANYSASGINQISKEEGGYDVELLDGNDLIFDYDGNFVGYDTY